MKLFDDAKVEVLLVFVISPRLKINRMAMLAMGCVKSN
jgi:hypothetical protein